MSKSGVTVAPECVSVFNELKLGKSIKYIIYKLSDNLKEIEVEDKSSDGDWESFRTKLLGARAVIGGVDKGLGPRYAVYDFQYDLEGGEGKRSKITFIAWSPDEGAPVKAKMTYSSSKEALKNALNGLAVEVQANNEEELEYDSMLKEVTRGKR